MRSDIPPTASARYDLLVGRLPLMTLVELLPECAIYYYEPAWAVPPLWFVKGPQSIIVAYSREENLHTITYRAQLWLRELIIRRSQGDREGSPMYAAWADPVDGTVRESCPQIGDWSGVFCFSLPKQRGRLPQGWPETDRERLAQLESNRSA